MKYYLVFDEALFDLCSDLFDYEAHPYGPSFDAPASIAFVPGEVLSVELPLDSGNLVELRVTETRKVLWGRPSPRYQEHYDPAVYLNVTALEFDTFRRTLEVYRKFKIREGEGQSSAIGARG
jgi:hypothetical protein